MNPSEFVAAPSPSRSLLSLLQLLLCFTVFTVLLRCSAVEANAHSESNSDLIEQLGGQNQQQQIEHLKSRSVNTCYFYLHADTSTSNSTSVPSCLAALSEVLFQYNLCGIPSIYARPTQSRLESYCDTNCTDLLALKVKQAHIACANSTDQCVKNQIYGMNQTVNGICMKDGVKYCLPIFYDEIVVGFFNSTPGQLRTAPYQTMIDTLCTPCIENLFVNYAKPFPPVVPFQLNEFKAWCSKQRSAFSWLPTLNINFNNYNYDQSCLPMITGSEMYGHVTLGGVCRTFVKLPLEFTDVCPVVTSMNENTSSNVNVNVFLNVIMMIVASVFVMFLA